MPETVTPHICHRCSRSVRLGSRYMLDGEVQRLCDDCRDQLHHCSRCEGYFTAPLQAIMAADGNRQWCADCVRAHSITCDDCGTRIPSRECYRALREDRERLICGRCYRRYRSCANCGTLRHRDDAEVDFVVRRGITYCSSCDPGEPAMRLLEYDYKPEEFHFHGNPKDIHYGVEFEVTAPRSTVARTIEVLGGHTHAYCKRDGSLTNGGYEIVTHPHTLAAHRELWKPFWAHARTNGLRSDGTTGMHVHIERLHLTTYRCSLMTAFLNSTANRDFVARIAGREANTYTKIKSTLQRPGRGYSRTTDWQRDEYGQIMYRTDPRTSRRMPIPRYRASVILSEENQDRYNALNLTNPDTVELRIFQTPMEEKRFWVNMEFTDALVHWSIGRAHHDLGVPNFCKFVRKHRKAYRALDDYLVGTHYLSPMPTGEQYRMKPPVNVSEVAQACA